MSDLIRRQDVIFALIEKGQKSKRYKFGESWELNLFEIKEAVESVPSAEPERTKGEWIEISWSEPDPNVCCTSYAIQSAKCSICGKCHTTPYLHSLVYFPYCPNCGAEMNRGE